MKIKHEHYAFMLKEISKNAHVIDAMRSRVAQDPRTNDVEKRLRWDMLWAANITPWITMNVYPYANDRHIDTALRRIMAEIEGN